jgi:hypothetical protein
MKNETKNSDAGASAQGKTASEPASAERDVEIAARYQSAGNDRELYAAIYGSPGEYPAMD